MSDPTIEKLTARAEAAERACAEKDKAINAALHVGLYDGQSLSQAKRADEVNQQLEHARSSTCGQGYRSPAEWYALQSKVEQLRGALGKVERWLVQNTDIVEENPLLDDVVIPALSDSPPPVVLASELEKTIQVIRTAIGRLIISRVTRPMLESELARLEQLTKGAD